MQVGEDLVLTTDDVTAIALPPGTLADDYLDDEARKKVDATTAAALGAWQERWGERLVIDGVSLPWLLQVELLAAAFLPGVATVSALRRAFASIAPAEIELVAPDPRSEAIARAAAGDIPLLIAAGNADNREPDRKSSLDLRTLRRTMLGAATRRGVRSRLRGDSVVVYGYWHLAPLIDRMLQEGLRPAVVLDALPPGPRRAVAAALRGGFVGGATPAEIARTRETVAEAIAAAPAERFGDVDEPLAQALHRLALDAISVRAPRELARLSTFRRTFARVPPRCLVLPNDVAADMRAAITAARENGVPTVVVQHGVYLDPRQSTTTDIDERLDDLETADEVAVWSPVTAAAIHNRARPIHVIGYPLQHRRVVRARGAVAKRVMILVQPPERITSIGSARMSGWHASTAIAAVLAFDGSAVITLRPHPSQGTEAMQAVADAFPAASVTVDVQTPIEELAARHDLCVAGRSTAAFQAARAGARVAVLNLSGSAWKWPLGGDTEVLVAHTEAALRDHLTMLAESGQDWPGRDALLETLGVPYGDGTESLLALFRP
jgi:hypothetical protein